MFKIDYVKPFYYLFLFLQMIIIWIHQMKIDHLQMTQVTLHLLPLYIN